MNKKTLKILFILNLIISFFLFFDYFLPGIEQEAESLKYFYNTRHTFSKNSRSKGYEIRSFVEISNGQMYRIGKLPSEDFEKNQKIKIIKTPIFNKINEILVFDKEWKKIQVPFISKYIILISILISIALTISTLYFNHKTINLIAIISVFLNIFTFILYLISQ